MCAAFAAWMKVSDMAASAMLMPPEAEPVMPASVVTVMASVDQRVRNGLERIGDHGEAGQRRDMPPKPYSDAVFIDASSAPATACLVPSAKRALTGLNANTSTVRMPSSKAASTAQTAAILPISVTSGWPSPAARWCASRRTPGDPDREHLVHHADHDQRQQRDEGMGSFSVAKASGSFWWFWPYPSPAAAAWRRRQPR